VNIWNLYSSRALAVKAFVNAYQRKARASTRAQSADPRRGGSPLRDRHGGSVSPTGERRLIRQHYEGDPTKIFRRLINSPRTAFHLAAIEFDSRYGMDYSSIDTCEIKLRIWLCNTVLRPLAAKIEELNVMFAEKFPSTHLRIGFTSPEQFKTALHSRPELCHTYLPFVLPYLRVHSDQNYLVQRIRKLAQNVALADFKWNKGGEEYIVEEYDDKNSKSAFRKLCTFIYPLFIAKFMRKMSWSEQLPTDSGSFKCGYCIHHQRD